MSLFGGGAFVQDSAVALLRLGPGGPVYPQAPDDGQGGIPGIFIFFVVVAILIGVGTTIWKVSTAQRLARDSGMDPGLATRMTLLSDDGLDATYLAASLRRPSAPGPAGPPQTMGEPPGNTGGATAAERLVELKALRDQSLLTQAEYDARRQAIIDAV